MPGLPAHATLKTVHVAASHQDQARQIAAELAAIAASGKVLPGSIWGAPKLPDSPSNRMDVWKGEVIVSTEEELLTGIQR